MALVGLALALRLGFVAAEPNYRPYADAADFDRVAVSLATAGRYPPSTIAPGGGPSAFRPPAYPYLLAGAYEVTGTARSTSRFIVARALSAVLSTFIVALVGLIAALVWGWGAALAGLLLAAIYPPLITVGDGVLAEPLFASLVLAAVAAVLFARRSAHRVSWSVAAGVLVGLAALSRTNGVIVLPVIAAYLLLAPGRRRSGLFAGALLVTAAVLTIAPWAVRNTLAFHQLIPLSTQAGFTLAGTYNDVSRADRQSPGAWRVPTMPPYAALLHSGGNEAELERRFRSTALAYATAHPGYSLDVAYHNLKRLLELQGPSAEHGAARETGVGNRTSDLDVYAFYGLAVLVIGAVAFGVLRDAPVLVWAIPAAMAVSLIFVIAYMRYRMPIDPFLLVLVAGLFDRGGRRLRVGPRWRGPDDRVAVNFDVASRGSLVPRS